MKLHIILLFIGATLYDDQFKIYRGAAEAHLGLIRELSSNAGVDVSADLSAPRRILGGIMSHIGNKLSSADGIQASASIGVGAGAGGNYDHGSRRDYQRSPPMQPQWIPENPYIAPGYLNNDQGHFHMIGNDYHRHSGHGLQIMSDPRQPAEPPNPEISVIILNDDTGNERTKQADMESRIVSRIRNELIKTGEMQINNINNYSNGPKKENVNSPPNEYQRIPENSYFGDSKTDLTRANSMGDRNQNSIRYPEIPHLPKHSDHESSVSTSVSRDNSKDETKTNENESSRRILESIATQIGEKLSMDGENKNKIAESQERGVGIDGNNSQGPTPSKNKENSDSHASDESKNSRLESSVSTSVSVDTSKGETKTEENETSRNADEENKNKISPSLEDQHNDKSDSRQSSKSSVSTSVSVDTSKDEINNRNFGNNNSNGPASNENNGNSDNHQRIKVPDESKNSDLESSVPTSVKINISKDETKNDENGSSRNSGGGILGGIISHIKNKFSKNGENEASTNLEENKENSDNGGHLKLPDLPKYSNPESSVSTSVNRDTSKDATAQDKIEASRNSGGGSSGSIAGYHSRGHALNEHQIYSPDLPKRSGLGMLVADNFNYETKNNEIEASRNAGGVPMGGIAASGIKNKSSTEGENKNGISANLGVNVGVGGHGFSINKHLNLHVLPKHSAIGMLDSTPNEIEASRNSLNSHTVNKPMTNYNTYVNTVSEEESSTNEENNSFSGSVMRAMV